MIRECGVKTKTTLDDNTYVLDKRFHPGDVSGLDYVVVRELMSLQMT